MTINLVSGISYEILDRLGAGRTAQVHLAVASSVAGFRKPCVIKSFAADLTASWRDTLLEREIEIAGSVQHANVSKAIDVVKASDGSVHLVFEFIHGLTLQQVLDACRRLGAPVSESMALFVAREAVRGLHFLHNLRAKGGAGANFLHADLSPGNVMISTSGDVRLIDFGLGVSMTETAASGAGLRGTTPDYASPEALAGEACDVRSDIYAAFVLLWEMLTLALPPRQVSANPSLRKVVGDAPVELDALLGQGLARTPSGRPDTAAKALKDLTRILYERHPDFNAEKLGLFVDGVMSRDDRQRFARLAAKLAKNPV